MAKAMEKRVVLAECGTLDRQLQTLKSLRRNGALQALSVSNNLIKILTYLNK